MTPAACKLLFVGILAWLCLKERRAERADIAAEEAWFTDWNRLAGFPYNPHFSDRDLAEILEGIEAL